MILCRQWYLWRQQALFNSSMTMLLVAILQRCSSVRALSRYLSLSIRLLHILLLLLLDHTRSITLLTFNKRSNLFLPDSSYLYTTMQTNMFIYHEKVFIALLVIFTSLLFQQVWKFVLHLCRCKYFNYKAKAIPAFSSRFEKNVIMDIPTWSSRTLNNYVKRSQRPWNVYRMYFIHPLDPKFQKFNTTHG